MKVHWIKNNFLVVFIVTLSRLAFINAYDNKFKNTVNAAKNILKVNIFSIIVVITTLVLILTDYFESHCTPNEYLKHGINEQYREAGFEKLTEYYNKVIYGRKKLTKEDIKDAIYI
ncbi:MAG: hypothetical protein FH761_06185 [Firmicutes bacterium]|nr:hypothetical protein [Bacillota bacterium]